VWHLNQTPVHRHCDVVVLVNFYFGFRLLHVPISRLANHAALCYIECFSIGADSTGAAGNLPGTLKTNGAKTDFCPCNAMHFVQLKHSQPHVIQQCKLLLSGRIFTTKNSPKSDCAEPRTPLGEFTTLPQIP